MVYNYNYFFVGINDSRRDSQSKFNGFKAAVNYGHIMIHAATHGTWSSLTEQEELSQLHKKLRNGLDSNENLIQPENILTAMLDH